jgi:hypothetical protein
VAHDRHVPQNTFSDEVLDAILASVRAVGAEEWTALLARALTVREEWDHASAELEESEATPGPNDGPWNPWHLLNHVGGFTACDAESLRALAAGESAAIDPSKQWQGDEKTFLELRSGAIGGWDEFIAAVTEATIMQPDGGTVTHPRLGSLSTREFIAFTLRHARDHARQMRTLRGLAEGENPADSAGDLGRRRQTAH